MNKNNANDWVYVPVAVRKTYTELKAKTKMRRTELDPYIDALNEKLVEKQKTDETYFACKKAFQNWNGKSEIKLKQKLQEIFTPQTQTDMAQQERIYAAQRPTDEALAHAKNVAYKTGNVNPRSAR